ncbi:MULTISPECIES: RNA 2',3'-cyclic phosphodiesterase [Limnochorda]|uniref:RNA 2',3'-cyclic phosphodiesterase n=1 Tax=Limnochorda TaxID=1676651 RepID=UPI0017912B41|nr:RNA 2',3'-cyclic phosphodiesterase [Limnochorda pilosa]MBO2486327.1 RNA 2',3'-cyclic phosphodiesterase [Bacillota bacterium]MBO2518820.1 RNA 2',3'-cyclic phosphodiesterase [Bacillota bacterium]NMA72188.1 RNA 2',3'-cyclic phosphodiesterase [Bacillota bacterium]
MSNEPVARSDRTGRPSPAKERARRLFIAVPLTAALQEAVVRVRAPLPDGRAIRWVAPENLHITLRFLGSVPERRLADVAGALAEASRLVGPFLLELGSCGYFPPRGTPRVLWVGVAAGGDQLSSLAAAVEEALARRGFPRETRAFRPHVTVARIREGASLPGVEQWLAAWEGESFGQMPVETVHLMESQLRPQGPLYRTLSQVPLGGGGS